ncbi:CD3324 family protein [Clostridium sp. KNHs205]|jgi:Mor family transcriptional regulator|uniref:CD3324 family protein n=1 Tax=Clostridium sp. KNHs205 TaxID=1449050 RepID=UPI00051BE449|nr:CD3324 family protein [Clostridium sp. KNHs205]
MGYRKAEQILPNEIIELIQNYVDGECIYIPRKENNRRDWGESTSIREELKERNHNIYLDYKNGMKGTEIADKYFLSVKSIQRIIGKMK